MRFAIPPVLDRTEGGPYSQSGMDENLEDRSVFFRGKLLNGKALFIL
jgi:hypothetical protein